jgi:hypothetical protein
MNKISASKTLWGKPITPCCNFEELATNGVAENQAKALGEALRYRLILEAGGHVGKN